MSNSLLPHGLYSPWNSPGQNTGVGSPSLLQGIFPTRYQTQVSHTAGRFFTSWATKEAHDQPRQHIKKQKHYFEDKGLSSQSSGFSRSHVQMWELDHKERWTPKNWTELLKKTLRSPLDSKEINQSILMEISPEYSLEGLMLKLKLQHFDHVIWRTDSL